MNVYAIVDISFYKNKQSKKHINNSNQWPQILMENWQRHVYKNYHLLCKRTFNLMYISDVANAPSIIWRVAWVQKYQYI